MNEFDCRIWDNEYKCMYYLGDGTMNTFILSKKGDRVVAENFVISREGTYIPQEIGTIGENLTLMLYIGIKDKKNNKIYEGDIVKTKDENGNEIIGVVRYLKGKYWIAVSDFVLYEIYPLRDDIEVIGNIYENPKLLESDKYENPE